MTKQRESNYDLLRIISAFMVIVLHASAGFLKKDELGIFTNTSFSLVLFNTLARFAVPCFFMLSGAFILADERNADYTYFYRKTFRSIGITSIIFCVLYFLYAIAKPILSTFILHKHPIAELADAILRAVKATITGKPSGHLWYLFTLLGIYIAAPFVIRLAKNLSGGVRIYTVKLRPCFLPFQVCAI